MQIEKYKTLCWSGFSLLFLHEQYSTTLSMHKLFYDLIGVYIFTFV